LNRIDSNTEEALQNVEKGKRELDKTYEYVADTRALLKKVKLSSFFYLFLL
jgi:hypothetical protein